MVNTTHIYSLSRQRLTHPWIMTTLAMILLCFTVIADAAKIQVGIDRVPVAVNESFQLIFSTSETPDGQPDFSPLKHDFEILNQQQSTQSSWINGKSSHTTKWILTVMAKRSGTLTIPAIHFGDDVTSPIQLTVEAQPATSTKRNDTLFLEAEVSSDTAYVQEQIIYTVRFYQRIQLVQAILSEPDVDNAVVESLSENSYRTQIDGHHYLVTERTYAIFPQESGTITIPPVTLTAQIAVDNDPFSRFDSFFSIQNTKTEHIYSEAVQITVHAIPEEFTGTHWLAVQDLTLQQSWSNNAITVNVGEPLTRTITLTAVGATASQLPAIPFTSPDPALKLYPDQASSDEQKSPQGITTVRQQKIAIIPSKAGHYTLAAIEIPWFNTQTQKVEIATLPAVTLTANAVAATTSSTSTPTMIKQQQSTHEKDKASPQQPSYFWQALTGLFGLLWLATLFYLFSQQALIKTKHRPAPQSNNKSNGNTLIKEIKQACRHNDPHACQQAFLQWAQYHYNTADLSKIKSFCSPALQQEIDNLQKQLYSNQTEQTWQGEHFINAFLANSKNSRTDKHTDSNLEPLHRL